MLCDQGSEASFRTKEVAQLLALPRSKKADEKHKNSNYAIHVQLQPRFSREHKLPVTLIMVPKLTSSVPNTTLPPIQEQSL